MLWLGDPGMTSPPSPGENTAQEEGACGWMNCGENVPPVVVPPPWASASKEHRPKGPVGKAQCAFFSEAWTGSQPEPRTDVGSKFLEAAVHPLP